MESLPAQLGLPVQDLSTPAPERHPQAGTAKRERLPPPHGYSQPSLQQSLPQPGPDPSPAGKPSPQPCSGLSSLALRPTCATRSPGQGVRQPAAASAAASPLFEDLITSFSWQLLPLAKPIKLTGSGKNSPFFSKRSLYIGRLQ